MKYILHLYQSGGCDYTIGCGHAMHEIETDSAYELRDRVKEEIKYYSRDRISEATLYQVVHKEEIHIGDLFAEDDEAEARGEREKKELEEKKMLAELKKKYPDS